MEKELHDFSHHGLISVEHLIEVGQIIMTMHGPMYGTDESKVSCGRLNVDSRHEFQFAPSHFGDRRCRLHRKSFRSGLA